MNKNISLEELIIELMPFSQELVDWCNIHPEFLAALKNVYPDKFISPAMIMTSTSPNYPDDEVIGVYSYHYQLNKPIFKQDFIVNKGRLNKEFVLYTRNPAGNSKYVKDINEFFSTYGKGGYYLNSHHLTSEQIPGELQERVKETMKLAEKVKDVDLTKINQEQINKVYQEVMTIKRSDRYVMQKMNTKTALKD